MNNMGTEEINRFFKKQSLASTYKPMFLKCLLDLGDYKEEEGGQWVKKQNDSLIVDLNFVIARFIRFYHPLYFKFKLKQFPHAEKQLGVYENLEKFKDELGVKSQPTKKQLCKDKFAPIREETIASDGIKYQVLPKLLNDCNIYVPKNKKSIEIKNDIVDYIRKNKNVLESGINFILARYLEGINASPNIATKLQEKIPRKRLDTGFSEIIELQDGKCFFCNGKFDDYAQEHFLPWNFIFRTENFNITAACKICNSKKNDRLPHEKYLEKIITRNKKLNDLPSGYSEEFFRQLYETCRIEYHGKDVDLWSLK